MEPPTLPHLSHTLYLVGACSGHGWALPSRPLCPHAGGAGPPRLIPPGPRKMRALIRLEDSAEEITENVLAVVAHPGQAGHPSPPVTQ